ncbi:MAG: DUF2807 domain-containing protein [Spirochaetaceae bacterium]|jgi:hypothetical protein|nr:DUF2807 domain-containing protein [Spirochaetaceae bacterium]
MIDWKKMVISIVMLGIGTAFAFARGRPEKGNGEMTSREHRVPAFERVHAGSNVDVRIYRAEEARVVVSADSNLHEFIEIRHDSKHNAVEIRTPGREKNFPRFTVDVYCPSLTGIGLAGTASIECADPVITETLNADMAGSGAIILRGNAERVEINLVGDGTIDGKEFKTARIDAHVVGDGKMTVWTDALTVNVVGNATVSYRGNPVLDIVGVGNGRFVRTGD